MSRINPVDRETNDGRLRKTFDAIQKQLGVVPNMTRTMAQSPAVLDAYLAFGAALRKGLLPTALQEQIALAVAEALMPATTASPLTRRSVAEPGSRATTLSRAARGAPRIQGRRPLSSLLARSSSAEVPPRNRTSRACAPPDSEMAKSPRSSRTSD